MNHYETSSHWPTMQGLREAFALVTVILAVGMLLWAVIL